MLKLSETEILRKIANQECFYAKVNTTGLIIKIETYVPYICTAIHNGDSLRPALLQKIALTKQERFYEEDPFTGELITSFPITLIVTDSRYEYDLNRSPNEAIYTKAWGKNVWQNNLTLQQKKTSLKKHASFYRIYYALLQTLEQNFSRVFVYDLHSYNYLRHTQHTPVFNLGTAQINRKKFGRFTKKFLQLLETIKLPNIQTDAKENNVFMGLGYLASFTKTHFLNTCVFALEIKKIFMDEHTGERFPLVFDALNKGLKQAIVENTQFCLQAKHTKLTKNLLSSSLSPEIKRLDAQLFKLAKGLETLFFVSPINLQKEKQRFFSSKNLQNIDFTYAQCNIDAYSFKESLYKLPVHNIDDIGLQTLYKDTINTLSQKIDLITSVGKEEFLYNSLKYYSRPQEKELEIARFLLFCEELPNSKELKAYDAQSIKTYFKQELVRYNMKASVLINNKLLARMMVNSTKRQVLINKNTILLENELYALSEHELGTHLLTTQNASMQELKILHLGLPDNTKTQEGLAILSEFLSGHLSLSRLKDLALRTLCVHYMCEGLSFRDNFNMLQEQYKLDMHKAFTLCARVYRGGGFSKDHLYLRGFIEALRLYKQRPIDALFVGKSSFKYLDLLEELIQRGILQTPLLPRSYLKPQKASFSIEFIIHSILTKYER